MKLAGIERLADEQRSKLQQQLRSACLLLGLQVSHSFITSAPPPPIEKKRSHIRTEAPHKPGVLSSLSVSLSSSPPFPDTSSLRVSSSCSASSSIGFCACVASRLSHLRGPHRRVPCSATLIGQQRHFSCVAVARAAHIGADPAYPASLVAARALLACTARRGAVRGAALGTDVVLAHG